MDEYDKKFAEMQKYIPFLEAMIERLQNVKDKSREIQLQKMQSLHGILSNSKRKLRIETLQRCEDVLQKLHNRVEKGNAALQLPLKQNDESTPQSSTSSNDAKPNESEKTEKSSQLEDSEKNMFDETPASPDPSVSPDSGCQVLPIIIPTERSTDFSEDKSESQQNDPNIPIITLIERTRNTTISSSDSTFVDYSDDVTLTEWDMLEESEKQNTKGRCDWQSLVTPTHDVATAVKMVSNNLPQKLNDSRSFVLGSRNVPTIPVPSLGGSRRLSSVLEKNKLDLDIMIANSRTESPVNVPDVRLKSPDPEILFSKPVVTSPKSKDNVAPKMSAKPPIPLLVSPPPTFTEPPLSMEDLAELLSEDDDVGKNVERSEEHTVKHKKNSGKQEVGSVKDAKTLKNFLLSQSDLNSESEKRWEEVDKHIVKLTTRKCLPNIITTSVMSAKLDSVKSNEIKGPPHQSIDYRPQASCSGCKFEPRYTDSYERHPRQRDPHSHEVYKDKPIVPSSCRMSEEEVLPLIPVLHKDERNVPLYQRRPSVPPETASSRSESEFRKEGTDYYNMHMNKMHWSNVPVQPSVTNSDQFGNTQWTPSTYSGMSKTPLQSSQHPYQHSIGMYGNTNIVDPHAIESQLRPNQFPLTLSTVPRPLISPTARSQDINHLARPESIREDIPPLISTTGFSITPQYRGFQMGQGSYDSGFDRSAEYSLARSTWEASTSRASDSYSGENVVPCGIVSTENSTGTSYSRPSSTSCPWPRDRDRCNRGRGRDAYYKERNRTEARSSFNRDMRDMRRLEWQRDGHIDRENRFNRDNRNMSDRDPRVRMEHSISSLNQAKETSSSTRDPRLAKDKHAISKNIKDTIYNERDPRKRSVPPMVNKKRKEKTKLQKSEKRGNLENSCKEKADKLLKDKMQSPLETLYGVIDTKAKSNQGHGLQKFKIPKIKRSEPTKSSANRAIDNTKEVINVSAKSPPVKGDGKKSSANWHSEVIDKDDATVEVSSSSDGNNVAENWDVQILADLQQNDVTKETEISSLVEETDKDNVKISEADSITNNSKSVDFVENGKKEELEADKSNSKEKVTRKWIEALIRKSLQCGKGKKLVEHANLIRKLGETIEEKKLKKIQKIIDSDSESSSSDKNETIELKKLKKKRRVIVSDSSDDECLAGRLEILSTNVSNEITETISAISTETVSPKTSSTENIEATIFEDSKEELIKNFAITNSDGLLENYNQKCKAREDDSNKERHAKSKETNEKYDISVVNCNEDNLYQDDQKNHIRSGHYVKENNESEDCDEKINQQTTIQLEELNNKKKEHVNEKVNVDQTSVENIEDTNSSERQLEHDKNQSPCTELIPSCVMEDKNPQGSGDKPKVKTKRRNSLEMLQEDIREMFISEDVVTATGFRMCRLPKENQSVLNSTATTPSTNCKKDEKKPNTSDKKVTESIPETDESATNKAKSKKTLKSRNSGESDTSKLKSKKDVQRPSRRLRSKEIVNSGSEEDQPLSLRTEWMLTTSNIQCPEKEHSEEQNDMPRRSKRVFRKDAMREPRVIVEKTDITKIESSKVMFDSSSDESFGIDVSVLAAAVDNSLRPEKQPDQESMDMVACSKRREVVKNRGNSKRNSKKNTALLADHKSEGEIFLTDEESVISDLSLSNSTIAKKKTDTSAKTSAKEELLSNILVGLVPSEMSMGKTTLLTDKGSEADIDEDAIDPLPIETSTKKSLARKKKKRFNWQMGILSKKRKKKTASSSKTNDQIEHGQTSAEINVSTIATEDDSLTANTNIIMANETVKENIDDQLADSENVNSITECDVDLKYPVNTDISDDRKFANISASSESSDTIIVTSSNKSLLSVDEDKPPLKMEIENVESIHDTNAMQSTTTTKNISTEPPKIVYDEQMEEILHKMDIKRLINYAWTSQDKFKSCLLCFFTGKNIVHHYKINHPEKEVLIARLRSADAEVIVKNITKSTATVLVKTPESQTCKFYCRFCSFVTEGAADVAREAFYEHCTTHTGEYRFHCNSCQYQTVAKSSMRTHYYKVCRKINDTTFNESVWEDDIPREDSVYGYLCCDCNYVQLKRRNVELHVTFWHRHNNTKILRFNMSAAAIEEVTSNDEKPQISLAMNAKQPMEEAKQEIAKLEDANETMDVPMMETKAIPVLQATDITKTVESSDNNDEAGAESLESSLENKHDIEVKEEINEKPKTSQGESEIPITNGNLSVFVCPPELENKEVEIQLERKKRMQEIANNIGIKIKKNSSKTGLSIIDKLKDKMRTEAINPVVECNISNVSQTKGKALLSLASSTTESLKNENTDIKENSPSQTMTGQDNSSLTEQSITDKSDLSVSADKADVKIRDPLAIMDLSENLDIDGEISDNENERRSAPIFESESSSEQSDSEPADVNMILKETSNINASSRDLMLTTIQRLAAQLQNAKTLDVRTNEVKVDIKNEQPVLPIPESPNVVPMMSIKRMLEKRDAKHHEMFATCNDASGPKNFIRFRRLSGDMLSNVPVQLPDGQKGTRASSTDGSQSDGAIDVSQTGMEEECSFLKIENVVSLAPKVDSNETESPTVNDIIKAVDISALKNKAISLLKKPHHPLILKKPNGKKSLTSTNMPGVPPTSEAMKLVPVKNLSTSTSTKPTTHLATNFVPIMPKPKIISLDSNKIALPKTSTVPITPRAVTVSGSSVSSNLNYKIVKVVRAPPLIKPKDSQFSSVAIKLKSVDAYSAMLKMAKLVRFYKCMSYDCRYTTDSITLYYQHYCVHYEECTKQKGLSQYGYQKCAYCYISLSDWENLRIHMEEKHAYCRYQCSYCFYRAIVPSYVEIHQAVCHPGSKFHFLVGKLCKPIPRQENINRSHYTLPFMCNHDCGKFFYVPETFTLHLRSKHTSSQSIFKCHLCNVTVSTIELLMTHYKTHQYCKYQCLYCLYGSDVLSDLHQHLSIFHCNRLPQALERSLPPMPTRQKDVIDQLRVRTFDGKDNEQIVEIGADASNFKKDASTKDAMNVQVFTPSLDIATYPDTTNMKAMLNRERVNPSNNSMSNSLGKVSNNLSNTSSDVSLDSVLNTGSKHIAAVTEKLDNNTNVPMTSTPQKQTVHENLWLNKDDENGIFVQSEKRRKSNEYTIKQILHEPELELLSCMNDSNAIDPLEFSGEFDCTDEFVNTNLLDNPEFLRNFTVNSDNILFPKQDIVTFTDKTEDSDIEILENIDNTKIAEKKKDNVNQIADSESSDLKTEKNKDQSISRDTIEVEHEAKLRMETPNSTNRVARLEELLTLDDIKDTGYTGLQLYKCGYEECNFGAQTAVLLRAHIKECVLGVKNKNLYCVHCKRRFIKVGFLIDHLKVHGLKRFGCSLCKMRYAVGYQATAHMKAKHKLPSAKLVPADPTNPSADGLFVVQAVRFGGGERKSKKRKNPKTEQENEEPLDNEKSSFNPDEIALLPRQAIYNREVQCAVCPYTTKVRTNIIRHLQLHAKDETVPEIGPVNPVPCLDKKEKMFDKMVNLASSSHQNGRMGSKPKEIAKESDENVIPKFVPEHKRYVCGVAECNYLTVDEAMLRYHLKALHSEEPYFRCPHCPEPSPGQESQNIAIDKMGIHLKMHDTRLYKCSHCNHHHYHRHVVERHLTDKHPEKRPFVKVIRELENTENVQQPVQEEAEEEVPDPDGNHWKCNICEFKCAYKAEMASHAATSHDEKCQYKCTLCSFKTSGKILFEQHINSKHAHDSNVDYILVYQRIKGINKRNMEPMEQSGQDEPFDTTPLWRRDMPRIRHIRGILLEEEDEISSTEASSTHSKISKRKSDPTQELVTKPAKMKAGKLSLDEHKQSKEKSKKSLSNEKSSGESKDQTRENQDTKSMTKCDSRIISKLTNDSKEETIELDDVNDSDMGRFGPYGKPDGNMYICTLCNQFKTKYKHDMRDHLYRELNYARWHCKACGYLSVNRNALLQHFGKHHNGEHPDHEPLSPDNTIEDWVMTLLKKQTEMIKASSQHVNALYRNKALPINISAASLQSFCPIPTKIIQPHRKTVNLAPAITTLQNDILRDANKAVDIDDSDSRDDEDLIIDIKDDETLESKDNGNSSENGKSPEKNELEKPLVCKHCQMKFSRWRGFKLHVQLTHLKRLGFLCPYCDRSTNSETLMRQHVRSKHPGCVEKIMHNPAAGGPELTNEFWAKEYGLICPQKSKKHKRKLNLDDSNKDSGNNHPDIQAKCDTCGFTAMNYTGLKSHMRSHIAKHSIKCSQCTFSCSIKAELVEHWKINHPLPPLKIQDVSAVSSSSEAETVSPSKKRKIDIYKDDIEEEFVSMDKMRTVMFYSCFYCNLRSHSLVSIKRHWNLIHKESGSMDTLSINLPFRYKEIHFPLLKSSNKECIRKDTESSNLSQNSASSTLIAQRQGWVCQWCQEFCETDIDTKTHQNMFHSHLPQNFKRQGGQEEKSKGYVCCVCSYATVSVGSIRRHIVKHVNLFKCKYCDQTFSTPVRVSAHNVEKHPGLETKIESISDFDSVVEKLMNQVKRTNMNDMKGKREVGQSHVVGTSTPRSCAVARKSTIKSVLYAKPIPRAFKAVARKSTNPLPRYLPGHLLSMNSGLSVVEQSTKTESPERTTSKQFSYYGIPSASINLARLNTYMVVGGHGMRVNCSTLAQLININPKIVLKDIKYDPKYVADFSRFD